MEGPSTGNMLISFNMINNIVNVVCRNVVLCRQLYKKDLFPANTKIVGYARSALSIAQLKERVKPFLKVLASGYMHNSFIQWSL